MNANTAAIAPNQRAQETKKRDEISYTYTTTPNGPQSDAFDDTDQGPRRPKESPVTDRTARRPAPPLDYRDFIPGQPSVITLASWYKRNELIARHYPEACDLMTFDEDHLMDVLLEVEMDAKPRFWFYHGFPEDRAPIAMFGPRRAWVEWFLFRGRYPRERREGISPGLRTMVLERDGYLCQICMTPVDPTDVHLDHIKPYSLGGPTNLANLRVTHSVCNMRKGAKWLASE